MMAAVDLRIAVEAEAGDPHRAGDRLLGDGADLARSDWAARVRRIGR
jgi:hypothetical protein